MDAIPTSRDLTITTGATSRDELADRTSPSSPYTPYPVQEEALLAWFTAEQGVLVCIPTGTGKTLIAQAALFEALHTGTVAYYTTPLIALTEQKFHEMQAAAVRWGFHADDVGLVTGNRRVNPRRPRPGRRRRDPAQPAAAPGGVRLHATSPPWSWTSSTASPTRSAASSGSCRWPCCRRTSGCCCCRRRSATPREFLNWLDRCHGRKLELVESKDRKVPLTYQLGAATSSSTSSSSRWRRATPQARKTPALVFCFNRDECWSVAEQLKGLPLLERGPAGPRCTPRSNKLDWTQGVGPKLKQMLHRGVGVHHAGLLPQVSPRRRGPVRAASCWPSCICTETLAAGINLPARSVVLTSLVKGPFGKEKLIDASTAHQIFGRAGRPQFDDQGYVFALAHEDDVKHPALEGEVRPDPREHEGPGPAQGEEGAEDEEADAAARQRQYWSEAQFKQLQGRPAGQALQQGAAPWRLLAYLLKLSPEVDAGPQRDPQAADGRAAHQGRREAPRPDAADAGARRLRDARPAAAAEADRSRGTSQRSRR